MTSHSPNIFRLTSGCSSSPLRDAETLLGANATPILYYEIVNFIYASGDPDQAAQAIERAGREGLFSDPEWRRVLAHYRLATGDIEGAIAEAETIDLQSDSIRASGDSLGAMIAEGLALGVRGLVAADRGDHAPIPSLRLPLQRPNRLLPPRSARHRRPRLSH